MFLAMNFIVLSISAVDTGRITISRGEKDGMGLVASLDPCPRVGQVTVNWRVSTSSGHLRNKLMRNHTTGVEITDLS